MLPLIVYQSRGNRSDSTFPRYPCITSVYHFRAFFTLQADLVYFQGFGLLAPGLSLSIGMPFTLPAATIIPTGKTTLAVLQSTGARYMLSVPSILEDMLRLPGGAGLEALRDLEIVAVGGAPMKESVGAELAAAGVNLLNHWGSFFFIPAVA